MNFAVALLPVLLFLGLLVLLDSFKLLSFERSERRTRDFQGPDHQCTTCACRPRSDDVCASPGIRRLRKQATDRLYGK